MEQSEVDVDDREQGCAVGFSTDSLQPSATSSTARADATPRSKLRRWLARSTSRLTEPEPPTRPSSPAAEPVPSTPEPRTPETKSQQLPSQYSPVPAPNFDEFASFLHRPSASPSQSPLRSHSPSQSGQSPSSLVSVPAPDRLGVDLPTSGLDWDFSPARRSILGK